MERSDDARPAEYKGDHPDGWYWAAEPPPGAVELPVDESVTGSVIRLMWDYGVTVPLWDAEGLLPEDPEWLRDKLDLSDSLIEDLTRWGLDMEELDAHPRRRTEDAYDTLARRGQELAVRLNNEVGSRFSIRYLPWRRSVDSADRSRVLLF